MSTSPVARAVRIIAGLALATVVVLAVMDSTDEPPASSGLPVGVQQTEFGPLTASDVDLLNKVRQAGLWEIPVGQQMQQRAANASVAEVGRRLATEHTELDRIVRQAADQLGVSLPSQPSAQQQAWMAEISTQAGADYDRVAVNRLRAAHGKVLPAVAAVRSGTRNERVRELATTAAEFVTRHHEYLESTGLVDYAALPEPAGPGAPADPAPVVPAAPDAAAAPVLTAVDTGAPSGAAALWASVRESPVSSWLAAVVAGVAVLGGFRVLDLNNRRPGATQRSPAGPRRSSPAAPFPPAPRGPGPRRPAYIPPHSAGWAPPPRRRSGVPPALGVVLLVVLLVAPALNDAAAPRPQRPALAAMSAAEAAGFAALRAPAGGFVLVANDEDDDESQQDGRRANDPDADSGGDGNGRSGNDDDQQDNQRDDQNNNDQNNDEQQNNEQQGDDDAQAAEEEFPGRDEAAPPGRDDFINIADVTPQRSQPRLVAGGTASGSFMSECGAPAAQLRNSDNWIVAPGTANGAQHVHDYVGNLATDADTSEQDLLSSDTTCALGDRSTYFWPALRDTSQVGPDQNADGGGLDGNVGEILSPDQVIMQFRGNSAGPVSPMPPLLRAITGDAKATTNGDANANAQWSCAGLENRRTELYPLCPDGSQLLRVLDFPNCWDGRNVDSADHREHLVFPEGDGGTCPSDTTAVPALRMILAYDAPPGASFALDGFPDQGHNPATDHADFTNVMPTQLMNAVVDCINTGQQC